MPNKGALTSGPAAKAKHRLRKVVRTLPADSLPRRVWARYKPAEVTRQGNATVRRVDPNVMVDVEGASEVRGVYLYGGCDTERMLDIGARISGKLEQSLAMKYEGHIASGRPDIVLQKLQGVPTEDTAEVVERFSLSPDYFKPNYFEPTFDVGRLHPDPIKKHAIVTTIGPAVTRTLYRHKTKDFIVDPGGWWLAQELNGVVPDKDTLKWFRKNFKSIGRLSLDEWEQQFRQLHAETVARTGAHLLVLNVLTVEPEDPTYIYSGRTTPETVRRRSFALRLFELSQELGVDVVDADRLLKEFGVTGAVDFAHMPREQLTPVIREGAKLMVNRGIIATRTNESTS